VFRAHDHRLDEPVALKEFCRGSRGSDGFLRELGVLFELRHPAILECRTGLVGGSDPIDAYFQFALGAPVLGLGEATEPRRPLREWLAEDRVELGVWRRHLSTLFPEVRARGYLELRGIDTLPLRYVLVPAVLACGVLYDDRALREVLRLFPEATAESLEAAGRTGMTDPDFRARAETLWDVALAGASRISEFLSPGELMAAREFRARYTSRGLDPASDQKHVPGARAV